MHDISNLYVTADAGWRISVEENVCGEE